MNGRKISLQVAIVSLCILHVTEAFTFSPANCCTQLGETVSKSLVKSVKRYAVQKRDGVCHLQAFVLYTQNRVLCVSPHNKRIKAWIRRQAKKKNRKRQPEKNEAGKRRRNHAQNKKKRNKVNKKKQKNQTVPMI